MKILVLLISAMLGGCAGMGSYHVNVDAIAAPDALSYRSYYLVPTIGTTLGLEFDSYAKQLERALEAKGMTRVYSNDQADAVIFLGYQVGQPVTSNYMTSIPQWGQTGYRGSQTYGTVVGNQYSSTTNYTPTYGVTGYQQVAQSVTSYPLLIDILSAHVDLLHKEKSHQLWSVRITAASRKPDLRSAFPVMLYAAQPYIAGDTQGMKTVQVPRSTFPPGR